jgi:hypothetical protein
MRCALLFIFFFVVADNGFAQQIAPGKKPPVPIISLQNTSDSGHCNKVKIVFKVLGAEAVNVFIRQDSAGIKGKWYGDKSSVRASDADYKGLKEDIDYDFMVEAINKYGKSQSPVITRYKCR